MNKNCKSGKCTRKNSKEIKKTLGRLGSNCNNNNDCMNKNCKSGKCTRKRRTSKSTLKSSTPKSPIKSSIPKSRDMMRHGTTITNSNIRTLVRTYLKNPQDLPEDLRNISNWDVSRVTDMGGLFVNALRFNEPLNDWDVSNVTIMAGMFRQAREFNQPLDKWDVSNVTDMNHMFFNAWKFNQPLNKWNVSNIRFKDGMFDNTKYNLDINGPWR